MGMPKHRQTRPNLSEQAQTTHAQPRRPAPSLPHSSGTAARGEKVQRRPRPRTRGPAGAAPPEPPGLALTPAPHPGATGRGERLGHPGGPFSRPRQRGRWQTRTKEKKEAATPRRPHRGRASLSPRRHRCEGLEAASPSQRHRCPAEAPFSPGRHTGMPP